MTEIAKSEGNNVKTLLLLEFFTPVMSDWYCGDTIGFALVFGGIDGVGGL